MDLNEIAIFVKVIEAGSFTAAAQQLQMPKSTVSAKLSALERRLGVTLVRRTTRKLNITEAGQSYYQQCVQALEQIAAADQKVKQGQSEPQGLLRLTAPVDLGGAVLPAVIQAFGKLYPKVSLEILMSDKSIDLVAEGTDLALRAGELKDSSLIAKKLGSVYFAPFAAPKYLSREGTPKGPRDLKEHRCLGFKAMDSLGWSLSGPGGTQVIETAPLVVSNDLEFIKSLTVGAAGIALLPTFLCHNELEQKKLVRILPRWRSQVTPVHFVYAPQKFLPPKLRAFIEVASPMIQQRLEME